MVRRSAPLHLPGGPGGGDRPASAGPGGM